MNFLLVALLAFSAPTATSADATYAPLKLYEGSWQVTRKDLPPGAKPDVLVNQCALVGQYFACDQNVNGSPRGLIVFIPTGKPGHFYTQTILPEGRATGRDELEISGNELSYTSRRDQDGKTTFYRNKNVFTDKNHIHYEQAQSNNGRDWQVQSSGEEVRTSSRVAH